MKTRLLTTALMICSVLSGAAGGQKKEMMDMILQDDKSGDYLIVTLSSGAYKFASCQTEVGLSGVGRIEISGCRVSLQDISESRLVVADIDLCKGVGQASITTSRGPYADRNYERTSEFVISDTNIRNSVTECNAAQN